MEHIANGIGEVVQRRHSEATAEESQDPSSRPGGTQDDNSFFAEPVLSDTT